MNKDLRQLTGGERLWLWRRRLGLNQRDMGARLGVGEEIYLLAEKDRPGFAASALRRSAPIPPLGPTTLPEALRLARRRSGKGSREAANSLGFSHVTLLAAERSGDEWLTSRLQKLGWRFPAKLAK